MFRRVVLLSNSQIKKFAVLDAVESFPKIFANKVEVVSKKPGDTSFAQPFGERSAFSCIGERVAPLKDEIAKSDDLYIVIENFIEEIECAELVFDNVAVRVICNGGRWVGDFCNISSRVTVPQVGKDWLSNQKSIYGNVDGFPTTFGEFLHQKNSECPKDDWFTSVDPKNKSRRSQIVVQLCVAFAHLKEKMEMQHQIKLYKNFPSEGISFKDIFPLLANPTLVMKHAKQLLSSRLGLAHVLFPSRKLFVAGLESRGLLIAAMLATAMDIGFVPLRKPGKLAFNKECPIVGKDYKKEYGTDRIEVQPEHLKAFKDYECILVDDILATGGSIEAAACVLAECGVKIGAILVLDDIAPIRSLWQDKFAANPVLQNIPVLCIL